jgi:hypothetical protein
MSKLAVITVCLLLVFSLFCPAFSQTPRLQIYFDAQLTQKFADPPYAPPYTIVDSLYIVAEGFDAYLSAIEYSVDYTPHLLWLTDITTGLNIGTTPNGIATAWPTPQNAYSPFVVAEVLFLWGFEYCIGSVYDLPLCANGHPATGSIRATRWPDLQLIYATNNAACICPLCTGSSCVCPTQPIPVEDSTWGQIKALYR